jgi:hypothetical protein
VSPTDSSSRLGLPSTWLRRYAGPMRFMRALGSSLLLGVLLDAACTITATPPGPETGIACGLTFSWKQDSTTCQRWMDQNCCAQLQACAGNGACSAMVRCVNACPAPRTDECVGTCYANSPAMVLDAVSACSKAVPPAVASSIPSQCEWP